MLNNLVMKKNLAVESLNIFGNIVDYFRTFVSLNVFGNI